MGGQALLLTTPNGQQMTTQIPAGLTAGQKFNVVVPNAKTVADAEALMANVLGVTMEMPRGKHDTVNYDPFVADNTLGTMGTS